MHENIEPDFSQFTLTPESADHIPTPFEIDYTAAKKIKTNCKWRFWSVFWFAFFTALPTGCVLINPRNLTEQSLLFFSIFYFMAVFSVSYLFGIIPRNITPVVGMVYSDAIAFTKLSSDQEKIVIQNGRTLIKISHGAKVFIFELPFETSSVSSESKLKAVLVKIENASVTAQ